MWLVQLPSDASPSDFNVTPIGATSGTEIDWIMMMHKIFALLFILGGFACLMFLLWGGILYIISGGKEESIQKATHTVRNAIIGLIIIILSYSIIAVIGKILNRDLLPYLNFETIVEEVNNFSGIF